MNSVSLMLIEIFLVAVATEQAIKIWRQGSIFDWAGVSLLKIFEANRDPASPTLMTRVRHRLSQLLLCGFCLSPWVAAVLWVLYCVCTAQLTKIPLFWLAALVVSRLANLFHDIEKRVWPKPATPQEEPSSFELLTETDNEYDNGQEPQPSEAVEAPQN